MSCEYVWVEADHISWPIYPVNQENKNSANIYSCHCIELFTLASSFPGFQ